MRRKIINKTGMTIVFILVLVLFLNLALLSASAEKNMEIFIEPQEKIYEGEEYTISVYDNKTNQFLTDVLIEIEYETGNFYRITEEKGGEITLTAPQIQEDREFYIKANKTGYKETETSLNISNKIALSIYLPDGETVDANKYFTVKVTEESINGKPVPNATVAIQGWGTGENTKKTDNNGRAFLKAPENREEITIKAMKEPGFKTAQITAKINIPTPWWESMIASPYFPIIISGIILLSAIIIVNITKKSPLDKIKQETNEIKREADKKDDGPHGSVITPKKKGAKVEEIRISRPKKEKKVVDLDNEKEETISLRKHKKASKNEWFHGTSEDKFELGKITGEIDEDQKDKWFEGINEIRDKIDNKLKERKKSEKEDDEY
ncbi:MAG: hypothetical protein V5A68_08260 [Candidatus Thermoplasmatota archaeon]